MVEATPERTREPVSDGVRVQILATEHWGQLATRSMLWNETFTRVGMYLTTLSAAVVAIALVAQASDFGSEFRLFALLVLPVVLFVGYSTGVRLTQSQELEIWSIVAMNRLRHAYVEIAPDLEPYFVTSHYDDVEGLLQSAGPYTRVRPSMLISSTPVVVAVVNSVVTGVIVALLVDLVTGVDVLARLAGVVAGLVVCAYLMVIVPQREIGRLYTEYVPEFPREPAATSLNEDADPATP
jgi:hypothetical protein